MELNREQIIKALECCIVNDWNSTKCNECPIYNGGGGCIDELKEITIALIKSQEQRIKELTAENERLKTRYVSADNLIISEAVRKYKSAIIEYYSKPKYQPTKEHPIKHTQIEHLFAVLDQIAKEMLEGKKE